MSTSADPIAPLREFVVAMTQGLEHAADEAAKVSLGRALLSRLIARDDWLPAECAVARPDRYAQYLLHCDPLERFSVVSFVWGPGQRTPVHNHTVWGLVGVLRGRERCEEYELRDGHPVPAGHRHESAPGDIDVVSPTLGDWHVVSNAMPQTVSVSIHVYGANIGAVQRQRLDAQGQLVGFVSGYDRAQVPNLWDRSRATGTA